MLEAIGHQFDKPRRRVSHKSAGCAVVSSALVALDPGISDKPHRLISLQESILQAVSVTTAVCAFDVKSIACLRCVARPAPRMLQEEAKLRGRKMSSSRHAFAAPMKPHDPLSTQDLPKPRNPEA